MRSWKEGDIIEERWEVFGAARGGMGQVYFVRDAQWGGAELAVKSLLLKDGQPPSNRARALFLRESQVWLDLGAHPNIVSGFYTLEVDGALRFFMEYVSGETLAAVLSGGRLPLARALDIALQISLGLEYVHAREAIHRDLKPQNCIVSERDTLRVTDFGLGKQLSTDEHPTEAASAALSALSASGLGTPLYMAPEQWRGLTHAKKPADVYSFGVVLYELLGGAHPFGTNSDSWRRYSQRGESRALQELLDAPSPSMLAVLQLMHQEIQPLSLQELGVEAPASLLSLASRCLEKLPEARPSFSEIKEELLFLYNCLLGIRYPRSIPPPMRPLSSGENNRAVSYFIMQDITKAKEILSSQKKREPDALYITLNEKLLRVLGGELSPTTAALETAHFLRLMHPNATQDPQIKALQKRYDAYLTRSEIITVFSYSKEQNSFVVGAADGAVHLYRASDMSQLRDLLLSRDRVLALSFVGASSRLIIAGKRELIFFDIASGLEVRRLLLDGGELTELALSPDGSLLAISSTDNRLRLFDTVSLTLLHRAEPHQGRITALAFSPSARHLATAGVDRTVNIWSFSRGLLGWRLSLVHSISGLRDSVVSLAFSPDERVLAAVALDGLFFATSLAQRVNIHARRTGAMPLSVAISPDNVSVLIGSQEGELFRFRLDGQDPPEIFVGHQKPIWALSFVSDDAFLSVSEEGVARWGDSSLPHRWPLLIERSHSAVVQISQEQERARLLRQLQSGELSAFSALDKLQRGSVSRDLALLESLHGVGLRAGRRVGLREVFVRKSFSSIQRAMFGPNEQLLLFSGNHLRLESLSSQEQRSMQGHTQELLDAAFSPSGRWLLSGAKDNTARLWDDLSQGSEEPIFPALSIEHPSWVTAVCMLTDDFFATASQRRVYFWRRGEVSPRWESASLSHWVVSLFASGDRERLYACSSNGDYQCLSVNDGERLYQSSSPTIEEFTSWRELHPRRRSYPMLGAQERLLCETGGDVLLRDGRTNEVLQAIRGVAAPIRGLDISMDGRLIVVGAADKKVHVFAVDERAAVVLEHQQPLRAVAISPDNFLLATSEEPQRVRLFETGGALLATLDLPFVGEELRFDRGGRFLLAQGENQARLWEIVSEWVLP